MAVKSVVLSGIVGWNINLESIQNIIDGSTKDDTIYFYLNSGGGYITEGVAILNYIRMFKGKTIARVAFAASMMTQIALACDEVQVFDNSIFMIHNAQGIAWGDHREMAKKEKLLVGMNTMLSAIYTKKTKKDKNHILELMNNDTWIFGEEIVEEGFADKLIDFDSDSDEVETIGDFSRESIELNLVDVEKAILEEHLTADKLSEQLTACFGSECNLAAMPSNEKLANSKKGDVMSKELQAKLDESNNKLVIANTTIKELQNSAKEGEVALAKGIETAKADEVNRIKGIMSISGIRAYSDNEEVQAKIYDGSTTVADMKAFLYDLNEKASKAIREEIEKDSEKDSQAMIEIVGKEDNEDAKAKAEAKLQSDMDDLDVAFID